MILTLVSNTKFSNNIVCRSRDIDCLNHYNDYFYKHLKIEQNKTFEHLNVPPTSFRKQCSTSYANRLRPDYSQRCNFSWQRMKYVYLAILVPQINTANGKTNQCKQLGDIDDPAGWKSAMSSRKKCSLTIGFTVCLYRKQNHIFK